MIKASPEKSQAFRVHFELPPDLQQKVPAGRVEVTAFFPRDLERRPQVDTVYVTIPEHGTKVHTTRHFDDASVVLDFDAQGRVLGAELTTTRSAIQELPEFVRYVQGEDDPLAGVMIVTALNLGRQFELALVHSVATVRAILRQLAEQGVSFELDHVRVREEVVATVKAEPAARSWRSEQLLTA
jgi:uncharacterized protein YuzE